MHKIKKTFFSIRCAIKGILTVFREERNFKLQIMFTFAALLLGLLLHISTTEMLFVILCCFLVIAAEIANTAIEDLCNKIEPRHDPVIGKIKDIMAGYVLAQCILAVIVASIIFLPKLVTF